MNKLGSDEAALDIRAAMLDTNRTVFYLTQWPTTKWAQDTALDAQCSHVSVPAPPEAFGNYINYGF